VLNRHRLLLCYYYSCYILDITNSVVVRSLVVSVLVDDVISGCDDVTVRPADGGQQGTHREHERGDLMLSLHSCTLSSTTRRTLLKVNVEISTFRGRSQGLPRGKNISSSIKGRIVLPL